jgi:hypothetical protein
LNSVETIHGTNTPYYLKRAKEAGARIVVIDPIYTNSTIAYADQWRLNQERFDRSAWARCLPEFYFW